jgi:hypothetical protein
VLLEVDSPLGVEIEPTYGLESLGKFPSITKIKSIMHMGANRLIGAIGSP